MSRRSSKRPTLTPRIRRKDLDRQEAQERAKKLAADYAQGRADTRGLLEALEGPQLDLLAGEDEKS